MQSKEGSGRKDSNTEEENLYVVAMVQELTVNISDELKLFLYPNYYVDFNASSTCVKRGKSWTMMDPTVAAGNGSEKVLRLQKESGYIMKYLY